MSLNASLNTAVSSLQTNQTLMRVLSANVASAGVEGYTKKTGNLENITLGSIGAGVRIADVTRTIDNFLLSESANQASKVAAAGTLDNFFTRLQDLFGSPENNSSIAGMINDFRSSIDKLALDPARSVEQFSAVTNAEEVATAFRELAKTIQNLRSEADQQIGESVAKVNASLKEIEQLNVSIVRNTVSNQPVGDFLDQRDISLREIANEIDVKWYVRASGETAVLTGSNYALLDVKARELNFKSPSGVSKATTYPDNFFPIEIEGIIDDLTPELRSGRMAALVDLRDNILPGLQDQLDQLADNFYEQVNRAHNSAMPVPGLKTFQGTRTTDPAVLLDPANPESVPLAPFTDTSGIAPLTSYGIIQFAVIDERGDAVGEALRVNLDEFKTQMEAYVTAATGTAFTYQLTVGDVINMLNGAYAATPPPTIPVPPTPAGWPAIPWPPSPALVMPSSTSDIAGLYNLSGASVAGGGTNGKYAQMINNQLVISLPATSPYGLAIDDTRTTFAETGETGSSTFNYLFGLNNLFSVRETSVSTSADIEVRADIQADPGKIGRGQLTSILRDPLDPTTEEWYVAKGDGTGARAISAAFDAKFAFQSAGSLPSSTQTLTEYAGDMIQSNAQRSISITNDQKFQNDLLNELKNRLGSVSGVNVDEELAFLVQIQNNYAASSRVISTVNSMYDSLLSMI